MQKKLIAMAVAGMIAAPAFAQSNVTVYGIIDTFLGYGKAGDTKFSGVDYGTTAGSRLGFKGSEDLGNGLKATFTLEQGFDTSDGSANSTRQFHRQAWVGLDGAFGFVGIGRQYAPGYMTYKYDPLFGGTFDTRTTVNAGLSLRVTSQQRWDNSVVYESKSMGGFSARLAYGFGSTETGASRGDDNKVGVGLNYHNGPLSVSYVYINDGNFVSATQDSKEHYIGAAYDFGGFKLMGSWQTADQGANDVDVYQIGGAVNVSAAGSIRVAYAGRKDDAKDKDAKSLGLGYFHSMSKRTQVYVGVNRTNNDKAQTMGVLAKETGKNSTLVGVGIAHTF